MSAAQLASLLSDLSLSNYAPAFHGASIADLKSMTDEELTMFFDNMGIPSDGAKKIKTALNNFRSEQKSKATVKSGENSDVGLPLSWKSVIDEKTQQVYYWNTVTNEVSLTRPVENSKPPPTKNVYVNTHKKLGTPVKLSDFDVRNILGAGAFGRVKLCYHQGTQQWVALKVLSKQEIIKTKQELHTINEKVLLEKVDHPFLVNLLGSFQDKYNLYLALDYVAGGELFTLLRRRKRFNNDVSVFYAGQVVLAFEHLHSKNIAYRDLKPENILIDKTGYLKITDFGFAKQIPPEERTYTICGTPEYLAPEIIQNRGHSTAADWWALGILIYELLCGNAPFESDNPYGIFKKILAGNMTFPSHLNENCKDLIKRLLNPKPAYRLGNLKNEAGDIKTHPWFKDLDWEALEQKKIRAPYIPKIASEDDTSNFLECEDADFTDQEEVSADLFKEFGTY